ncbi:MAG: NAD-binding protein [Desulfobulbaceae bacterium]|nr:NAD-binding protein [Desulfobulbaceae bacterium]
MPIILHLWKKFFKSTLLRFRLIKVIMLVVCLNLFFGLLFYLAETKVQEGLSLYDGIWWAMVTMTTVGYGDYYPHSLVGRFLVSFPCMLVGIGVVGYLVGVVADSVINELTRKKRGLVKIKEKNHIIICNNPGTDKILALVTELKLHPDYTDSVFVLITDNLTELPEDLVKKNIRFVKGDPIREDVLVNANVSECKGVFVLAVDPMNPQSDAKNFATATIIELIERETGRPIKVVVEMVSSNNIPMMKRSMVDGIVSTEGITDCLMVQEFLYPGVHDIIQQIVSNTVGSQFYIFDTTLQGHTVFDIQVAVLKHPANLQVIGIIRQGKPILNPAKKVVIKQDDKLIMLAENKRDFESIEKDILNQKK